MLFDTEVPGDVVSWTRDDNTMNILKAIATNIEDGNTILRVGDSPDEPWRELKRFPYSEDRDIVDFCADNE